MLLDPFKMKMAYLKKCSTFLYCCLKFCERNPTWGSSGDKKSNVTAARIKWNGIFVEHVQVLQ